MKVISFLEAAADMEERERRETEEQIPRGQAERSPCCGKPLRYNSGVYPICSSCGSDIIVDFNS